MDRRIFLRNMSIAAAATLLPPQIACGRRDRLGKLLPMRKLGNTGESITMLGVGGWHLGDATEKEAQAIVEVAMEEGVRFIDTAHAYGKGRSEERIGKLITPKYRDEVFLMTKSGAPDYKTARKELELSLNRLKTDHVDLWQMHSIMSPDDADSRIKSGVLRMAEEALKEGKIRYIGVSGHADPAGLVRMMDNSGGLISALQCPVIALLKQSYPKLQRWA